MDGGYIGAVHSSPKPVARAWRYGSKDGNGSPMIGTAVWIRFSSLSAMDQGKAEVKYQFEGDAMLHFLLISFPLSGDTGY
jgi:hypothetical protein